MDYICKDGSHLKDGYILKNGSHLENWVTLGKMCHTWKTKSRIGKNEVGLRNVGPSWKKCITTGKHFGSHLEKLVTLKKKRVTQGKIGRSWKNGLHRVK